jgi:TATA-box binding protein (TBP) (component of TFIID and TFIIIB)
MVEWKITNSTFTVKFDTFLPLEKIAEELSGYKNISVEYDPSRFSGLILYSDFTKEDEKIKVIIFSSGLMNITGLKDVNKLISVIEKIKERLSLIGIKLPKDYELKVTNIIINGKFDYDYIDIEKMASEIDEARYDPSRFPAASIPYYVSNDYKVTFIIFKNGKFNCTGIKGDISDINQHINEIVNSFQENIIKKYIKQ